MCIRVHPWNHNVFGYIYSDGRLPWTVIITLIGVISPLIWSIGVCIRSFSSRALRANRGDFVRAIVTYIKMPCLAKYQTLRAMPNIQAFCHQGYQFVIIQITSVPPFPLQGLINSSTGYLANSELRGFAGPNKNWLS